MQASSVYETQIRPQLEANNGTLVFHAAATSERHDSAILLVGLDSCGKSTLAAQLCAMGHRLVSDDAAHIQFKNSTVYLTARRARMRLRLDSRAHFGFSALSERDELNTDDQASEDWVPIADFSACGGHDPLRIECAYLLETDPDCHTFSVQRVPPYAAFKMLLPHLFTSPDAARQTEAKLFEQLVGFSKSVPIFRLGFERSFSSLQANAEALVAHARTIALVAPRSLVKAR
jgi:hypothetical protein